MNKIKILFWGLCFITQVTAFSYYSDDPEQEQEQTLRSLYAKEQKEFHARAQTDINDRIQDVLFPQRRTLQFNDSPDDMEWRRRQGLERRASFREFRRTIPEEEQMQYTINHPGDSTKAIQDYKTKQNKQLDQYLQKKKIRLNQLTESILKNIQLMNKNKIEKIFSRSLGIEKPSVFAIIEANNCVELIERILFGKYYDVQDERDKKSTIIRHINQLIGDIEIYMLDDGFPLPRDFL